MNAAPDYSQQSSITQRVSWEDASEIPLRLSELLSKISLGIIIILPFLLVITPRNKSHFLILAHTSMPEFDPPLGSRYLSF